LVVCFGVHRGRLRIKLLPKLADEFIFLSNDCSLTGNFMGIQDGFFIRCFCIIAFLLNGLYRLADFCA
jgi:hypothetical protein